LEGKKNEKKMMEWDGMEWDGMNIIIYHSIPFIFKEHKQ
jgi:hypothetical protein